MAMSLRDFRVLEKTMQQTTSTNDAEALAAIRAGNALLAKYNYTWADAFARLVRVDTGMAEVEDAGDSLPQDHTSSSNDKDAAQINTAFQILRARQLSRNTELFIQSLQNQWTTRGFLTDKQKISLFNNAEKP